MLITVMAGLSDLLFFEPQLRDKEGRDWHFFPVVARYHPLSASLSHCFQLESSGLELWQESSDKTVALFHRYTLLFGGYIYLKLFSAAAKTNAEGSELHIHTDISSAQALARYLKVMAICQPHTAGGIQKTFFKT